MILEMITSARQLLGDMRYRISPIVFVRIFIFIFLIYFCTIFEHDYLRTRKYLNREIFTPYSL